VRHDQSGSLGGDDTLDGAGDELLFGNAGNDILTGGLGKDILNRGPEKTRSTGTTAATEF
jgi:Ca2+-binding RTX toxin-like protein